MARELHGHAIVHRTTWQTAEHMAGVLSKAFVQLELPLLLRRISEHRVGRGAERQCVVQRTRSIVAVVKLAKSEGSGWSGAVRQA